jgi:hypothetical protein
MASREVRLRGVPTVIAEASNGTVLYVACKNGEIVEVDRISGKKKRIKKPSRAISAMVAVGNSVIFGESGGALYVISNGEVEQLRSKHTGQISSISIIRSKDETHMAVASKDKRVSLWKVEEAGKKITAFFLQTLYGPTSPIVEIDQFCNPNRILCVAELSNTVRVFKIDRNTQLLYKLEEGLFATCAAFISEDFFAVSTSANQLCIFGLHKNTPLMIVPSEVEAMEAGCIYDGEGFLGGGKAEKAAPGPKPLECAVSRIRSSGENRLLVAYKTGQVLLLKYVPEEGRLFVCRRIEMGNLIINDVLLTENELIACSGKEERGGRFYVNKGSRNALLISEL